MKTMTRLFSLFVALGIVGCSEKLVVPHGKVHKNGQVLPVKDLASAAGGKVRVTFYPLDKEGKLGDPKEAIYNGTDGTFTVGGANNNGIPAGKYKIAVSWQDNFPMGPDLLKGAFSVEKTQMVLDLTGGEVLDIDVAKPPTGK